MNKKGSTNKNKRNLHKNTATIMAHSKTLTLHPPQELKILKSKVDVEAEQNASSFTSTVNTEPTLGAI